MNLWKYSDYCKSALNSTSIAEKYWFAKALSKRGKGTKNSIAYLKTLLKDDSVNVKCASISALSALGCHKNTLKIFKNLIIKSQEWYIQQYAYRALKKCQ